MGVKCFALYPEKMIYNLQDDTFLFANHIMIEFAHGLIILVLKNKESPEQVRGIEDFSLMSLRMWGNKSPTPPVFRSKLRGIKPKKINKIFRTLKKIMVYARTAHNRSVYAAPAVAGLASIRLGRLRLPRRIAAHAVPQCGTDASPGRASYGSDASQSPYPGWQNVVNSRNVMRHLS
jgi:hypothetical protein